ncbi:MAG TPA: PilZ domain-containing protein [Candidatus Angelobacter sp.]|nr:PilZ domain-containing protein [Candidatus Angelobacter sp.]
MEQAQMQPEKRSVRRFSLNLPVKLKNGSSTEGELTGQTRNVSSRGAFVEIESPLEDGASVEFLMTLPEEITLAEPIRVRCQGKVLRVEQGAANPGIAVAIEKYDFLGAE